MSYNSLNAQSNDEALMARVNSCLHQEARVNPAFQNTVVADQIRRGIFAGTLEIMWDVCIDTEEAYEYALNVPVENPGADETVITDAAILSSVQLHWPDDPT